MKSYIAPNDAWLRNQSRSFDFTVSPPPPRQQTQALAVLFFYFPAVIRTGICLLKFNHSVCSFNYCYPSARRIMKSNCPREETDVIWGKVILLPELTPVLFPKYICRQTNRCIPLRNFFVVILNLSPDAHFLKPKYFHFFGICKAPPTDLKFNSIPSQFQEFLFLPSLVYVQWVVQQREIHF